MNAVDVVTALKTKWPSGLEYCWMEQVRNSTGATRTERYADAIVVSCWPSRGIWLAGIEVKVSRSDWLRELRDPTKAEPIQRFCDYWWVASPPGIVEPSELPEEWGHVMVREGKRCFATKKAPKLDPEPMSGPFVASILRNRVESEKEMRRVAVNEARERWEKNPDAW